MFIKNNLVLFTEKHKFCTSVSKEKGMVVYMAVEEEAPESVLAYISVDVEAVELVVQLNVEMSDLA